MVTNLIQIVWLVAAVGLVILVMLHSPKGDGLGALGGQAQLFTSTKSAETALNRATWTLTLIFMSATVLLSAPWILGGSSGPAVNESVPLQPGAAPAEGVPPGLSAPPAAPAPVSE